MRAKSIPLLSTVYKIMAFDVVKASRQMKFIF
jgi:hypothetical protein